MPAVDLTPTVELLIGSTWVDVTRSTREDTGPAVDTDRGRGDEHDRTPPAHATLYLINNDGRFSSRNPRGPYFGQLGRNTPVRVSVPGAAAVVDDFTRAAASGLGTSSSGLVWGLYRLGAATFATTGTTGTVTVAAANDSNRAQLLDKAYINCEYAAAFTMAAATGAALEPGLVIRYDPAGGLYTFLRANIAPGGATTLELRTFDADGTQRQIAVTGTVLTFAPASPLNIKIDAFGDRIRGRVWQGAEPTAWQIDTIDTYHARTSGLLGVRVGRSLGNTNSAAPQFTIDNITISEAPRFVGEIASWPPTWTTDVDVAVPVEAAGVLRRLEAPTAQPLQSAIRRATLALTAVAGRLVAYWPMEDGSTAVQFSSALDAPPLTAIGPIGAGSWNEWPGSAPVAQLRASGYLVGAVSAYTPTGTTEFRLSVRVPTGSVTTDSRLILLLTTGSTSWSVWCNSVGNLKVVASTNTIGFPVFYDSGYFGFNILDVDQALRFALVESGGSVLWSLSTPRLNESGYDTFVGGGITAVAVAGCTVGVVTEVRLGDSASFDDVPIGHAALGTQAGMWANTNALLGFAGEPAGVRAKRLCAEAGVAFAWVGDYTDTEPMGPQGIAKLRDLLEECVEADGGILYEPRDSVGMAYRTRNSIYNQAPALTLDYAAQDVAPGLRPVDDDRDTENDITVTRIGGSSYQAVLPVGRMSIQDPPDGAGRYAVAPPVSLHADTQLRGQAYWRLSLGTWDEARYPSVPVNVTALAGAGKTGKALAARRLDVGDRVVITNPPSWLPPEDISQVVQGLRERLGRFDYGMEANTAPEGPYALGTYDDPSTSGPRPDTEVATLLNTYATTDTTFRVAWGGWDRYAALWSTADEPYEWRIPATGERVRVTAMATNPATFVAAGAAASGNNVGLSPALPAGVQKGDLLLIVAAARSTTSTVDVPAGWTQLAVSGNLALLGRIHSGSESAPLVTFSGTAAGDDTLAQMAAWRNVQLWAPYIATQINASAQNIAYPALGADRGRCLALAAGWKQDDWTSVATLAGWAEVGEVSSAAGNDAGLVWDYQIQTTSVDITAGSLVVTGGASAVSASLVALLAADVQTATVTRAINGIASAPAQGAQVRMATPLRYAL